MQIKTKETHISLVSPSVYEVEGQLTYKTVNQVQKLPEQLLTNNTTSQIRLNKVQHIDSAGLALLIDWGHQSLSGTSPIMYTRANQQLLRLVNLYHLDTVIPIQAEQHAERIAE